MHLADGTVIDTPVLNSNPQVGQNDSFLKLGQIMKVNFTDQNDSRTYVEYDVLVNEGRTVNVMYKHVRALDEFGDANNFTETVLAPHPATVKKDQANMSLKIGSWVLLGCLYGRKNQAVILKAIQNPTIRSIMKTTPVEEANGAGNSPERDAEIQELPTLLPGASSDEGQRMLGEFVGVRWNINKAGELTIMVQGPKDDKGKLTSDAGPTLLKFNKDGEFLVLDDTDQQILVSPKKKIIKLTNNNGEFIEIDSNAKAINISSSQDTNLESGGDTNQDVSGNLNNTVKGNWQINVTGIATIQAAEINLNGQTGMVLTTTTDPVIDSIFGIPTVGVPTVKSL
jgi:hypothetical protein